MGREVTLIWVECELHQKILDYRSVENTVQGSFFRRLWDASNLAQREEVKAIIFKGDKVALRQWMQYHPDIDLGEMSLNQLKKLGQRLQVANYSRLTRNMLVQEIEVLRDKKQHDSKTQDMGTQDGTHPNRSKDQTFLSPNTSGNGQHPNSLFGGRCSLD